MSFLGGALDKLDPSERVKKALTADLESRVMHAAIANRFVQSEGYRYLGSADLLLKHGRFFPGRELPDQYEHLRGPMSLCFMNALLAAEAESSLTYHEGVYTTGHGIGRVHAWCVDSDGGVVELTMPTHPHEIQGARNVLNTAQLPPDRWGYFGAPFTTEIARWHFDGAGLPMFDRSPREKSEQANNPHLAHLDYSEPHDFPILKVPYDPNRKDLP